MALISCHANGGKFGKWKSMYHSVCASKHPFWHGGRKSSLFPGKIEYTFITHSDFPAHHPLASRTITSKMHFYFSLFFFSLSWNPIDFRAANCQLFRFALYELAFVNVCVCLCFWRHKLIYFIKNVFLCCSEWNKWHDELFDFTVAGLLRPASWPPGQPSILCPHPARPPVRWPMAAITGIKMFGYC